MLAAGSRGDEQAKNRQIHASANISAKFYFPKVILLTNIIAWLIATACVGLLVLTVLLMSKSIDSYVVTESGIVVSIQPLDGKLMDKILSRKGGR